MTIIIVIIDDLSLDVFFALVLHYSEYAVCAIISIDVVKLHRERMISMYSFYSLRSSFTICLSTNLMLTFSTGINSSIFL